MQEFANEPKEILLLTLGFRLPELAQLLHHGEQFLSLLLEGGSVSSTTIFLRTSRLTCTSLCFQYLIEHTFINHPELYDNRRRTWMSCVCLYFVL
jgi:hypothetical protein